MIPVIVNTTSVPLRSILSTPHEQTVPVVSGFKDVSAPSKNAQFDLGQGL